MSIKSEISEYLRSGQSYKRGLGLEIEHFIVDANGDQIGFDEVSRLIYEVGTHLNARIHYMDGYPVGYATDDHSISLEPSCQFEISINPYQDLADIRRVYDTFYSNWQVIFGAMGYRIITAGNLPKVELGIISPDDIPLSPKKRYKYMDSYFQESGRYGRYMMRSSGSAQVSVDYRSEEDMVRKLRILSKISPIFMILMENKADELSALPGVFDKPHLLRIQEWDDLDPGRTGFVPHSLEEGFGYDKMAEVIYNTPLILLTDEGETSYVGSKSAKDLIEEGIIDESSLTPDRRTRLIEHFMSMGFFHFRVKKYIEIRVADAVPIDKALGYVALIKGLIYSDENLDVLEKSLSGIKTTDEIQAAVVAIEKDGLGATIYEDRTAYDWAEYLTGLAARALPDEDKEYLNNVRVVRSNV